jgi:head-tail adaptor
MTGVHLDRRMVLEAPVRVADGAGGFHLSWAVRGVLWAALAPGAGREAAGVEVRASQVPYRITLRAAPVGSSARPKPEDRLRDGTRVFTLLAVTEADPRGRYLTCFAREEVPA